MTITTAQYICRRMLKNPRSIFVIEDSVSMPLNMNIESINMQETLSLLQQNNKQDRIMSIDYNGMEII